MGKVTRFIASEAKRHYWKNGPSATQKQWKAIENVFESARECVREYELREQLRQDRIEESLELLEHIKSGGRPY